MEFFFVHLVNGVNCIVVLPEFNNKSVYDYESIKRTVTETERPIANGKQ